MNQSKLFLDETNLLWQTIAAQIYDAHRLNTAIYDSQGQRINRLPFWANTLCPIIKATKEANDSICAVVHQYLADQASQTRQAAVDLCDAGLIKIVVPIYHQDTFLGVVSCCGSMPEEGELEDFLVQKTTGFSDEELQFHSQSIKTISKREIKLIIETIKDAIGATGRKP